MTKISMHIQPSQYEFIGFEYESTEGLQAETVLQAINDFKIAKADILELTKNHIGPGLPDKEFKAALDEYLSTGTLRSGTELYAQMNPEQQKILQTVKLSLKRIKSKAGEPEIE